MSRNGIDFDVLRARYADAGKFLTLVDSDLRRYDLTRTALAIRAGFIPSNALRWFSRKTVPSVRNMILLDAALEELIFEEEEV